MIDLMILLGAFLGGAMCGFLLLLRIADTQDGRHLQTVPQTRAAAAARRLTGLCVQVPTAPAEHEDGRQ